MFAKGLLEQALVFVCEIREGWGLKGKYGNVLEDDAKWRVEGGGWRVEGNEWYVQLARVMKKPELRTQPEG